MYQSIREEDETALRTIVWNREQANAYLAYLKGTALPLDCLQLAMVSKRKGIKDRLLLPAVA